MYRMVVSFSTVVVLVSLISMSGCPLVTPPTAGEGKAITLITAGGNAKMGGGPVDLSEILSLELTVTEINLDYAGNSAGEGEGEGEGESEDDTFDGDTVTVFSGNLEIDLLNLTDISEILSESDVPAGRYTKVRISIANPRLILASDPETVITDVHLTANNRLFVSQSFEVPEDQTSLIVLDLGSIALRAQGNGGVYADAPIAGEYFHNQRRSHRHGDYHRVEYGYQYADARVGRGKH